MLSTPYAISEKHVTERLGYFRGAMRLRALSFISHIRTNTQETYTSV